MFEKIKEAIETLVAIAPYRGGGPEVKDLLADLPAEAIAGPKTDARGEPLHTYDAELTGYLPAYVWRAAVERLGPGGWVDFPIWEEPQRCTLARGASEPDGWEQSVILVVWFPTLGAVRVQAGTGRAKVLGDARKAAKTSALKRALAEVGIGWRGYTDTLTPGDGEEAEQHKPAPMPKSDPTQPKTATASTPAQDPTPSGTGGAGITDAQKKLAGVLLREAGIEPGKFSEFYGKKLADFTKHEASKLIESLKDGTNPLLTRTEEAKDAPF